MMPCSHLEVRWVNTYTNNTMAPSIASMQSNKSHSRVGNIQQAHSAGVKQQITTEIISLRKKLLQIGDITLNLNDKEIIKLLLANDEDGAYFENDWLMFALKKLQFLNLLCLAIFNYCKIKNYPITDVDTFKRLFINKNGLHNIAAIMLYHDKLSALGIDIDTFFTITQQKKYYIFIGMVGENINLFEKITDVTERKEFIKKLITYEENINSTSLNLSNHEILNIQLDIIKQFIRYQTIQLQCDHRTRELITFNTLISKRDQQSRTITEEFINKYGIMAQHNSSNSSVTLINTFTNHQAQIQEADSNRQHINTHRSSIDDATVNYMNWWNEGNKHDDIFGELLPSPKNDLPILDSTYKEVINTTTTTANQSINNATTINAKSVSELERSYPMPSMHSYISRSATSSNNSQSNVNRSEKEECSPRKKQRTNYNY